MTKEACCHLLYRISTCTFTIEDSYNNPTIIMLQMFVTEILDIETRRCYKISVIKKYLKL